MGAAKAPVVPFETDWLLAGITAELRRRGLWMQKYPMPKKLLPENYEEKAAAVREHLVVGFGRKPTRVEGMSLAGLAAEALAEHLTRGKVAVTPKTMLYNLDKIPIALEDSFPGYWGQGLLEFCVRGRKQ